MTRALSSAVASPPRIVTYEPAPLEQPRVPARTPAVTREPTTEPNPLTRPPTPDTARGARLRFGADGVLRQQQLLADITVLPPSRRATVGPPVSQATLAPGTPTTPLFSENQVPMSAMVLNSATVNGDGLEPRFIAQAARQANPDVQFLVPTQARFDSRSDPRFVTEQQRLADRLGVPAANVVPVRSDMAVWPQDEFLAGVVGGRPTLTKPLNREGATDTYTPPRGRPGSAPPSSDPSSHWNLNQRTLFAANDLAGELGIQAATGDMIARGGDTQVVTRPDGQQAAFFSAETIDFAGKTRGIDTRTDAGFIRALDVTMRGLRDAGIPLENQAPIGRSDTTYGQALDKLSDAERRGLHPAVLARLQELRDLPLPKQAYAYHTDVTVFTPDGKTMFVNEAQAKADPDLERQLRTFGYDVRALPSTRVDSDDPALPKLAGFDGSGRVSYMNMVMGRAPDGRLAILMPTETQDPAQLTANDQRARAALLAAMPEAQIIPVGGRSAITGHGSFDDGTKLDRDWGMHCLSNVLPFVISPK